MISLLPDSASFSTNIWLSVIWFDHEMPEMAVGGVVEGPQLLMAGFH